jgi:hypothetical protein
MRREDHGPNDRVQPGGVTAPGGDGNAHESLSTSQPFDGLKHLTRRGVPADGLLGEGQLPVHANLEQAARRLDQSYVRLGKCLLQLSRQTGGPGFIISDNAILNRDMHGGERLRRV